MSRDHAPTAEATEQQPGGMMTSAIERLQQFTTAALMVLCGLLVAGDATAGQDPVVRHGFDANQIYDVHDVDSVNAYTGQLNVAIPLGETYKTDGTLAYRFVLSYSSHLWDFDQYSQSGPFSEPTHFTLAQLPPLSGDAPPALDAESYPGPQMNAGLGFTLTLGELRNPYSGFTYTDSSGGGHDFRGTSPQRADADVGTIAHGLVIYTVDGSYLRMRVPNGDLTRREIDFPDGTRQRFHCTANCASATGGTDPSPHRDGGAWLLEQISDPFGHVLYITRDAAIRPAAPSTWTWNFIEADAGQDGYLVVDPNHPPLTIRQHSVTFEIISNYEMRVQALHLAAPGGIAEYRFGYGSASDDVHRFPAFTRNSPDIRVPLDNNGKIRYSMLQSVTIPASAGAWSFTYHEPSSNEVIGTTGNNLSVPQSYYSKLLESLTLPSGGSIRYTYGTRLFLSDRCGGSSQSLQSPGFKQVAVTKRQIMQGQQPDGNPWLYAGKPILLQPVGGICDEAREFVSTVVDPIGVTTVSYFKLFSIDSSDPQHPFWTDAGTGLPFSPQEDDSAIAGLATHRYISTKLYQCSRSASGSDDAGLMADDGAGIWTRGQSGGGVCGYPYSRTFMRYEGTPLCPGCGAVANFRVASQLTAYPPMDFSTGKPANDSLESYSLNENSNFDGLGHYRKSDTAGNFFTIALPNAVSGAEYDHKSTTTNYNPGLVFDAVSNTFNGALPGASTGSWLPNLYDQQTTTQLDRQYPGKNYETSVHQTSFNQTTGWLERERTLTNTNVAGTNGAEVSTQAVSRNDDVVTHTRTHNADGSTLVRDLSFGGDRSPLPSSSTPAADGTWPLAALQLSSDPTDAEYAIDHLYRFGTLAQRSYLGCSGSLTVEQNDLDQSTGLVTASIDVSGLRTTFAYDALGRVTLMTPPGNGPSEATPTVYTYTPPVNGTGARVDAVQGGIRTTTIYDHLGRVFETRSAMPTGENVQRTHYFANGWKRTVSTLASGTTSDDALPVTEYQYDPFGRPTLVTHPDSNVENDARRVADGWAKRTKYQYQGHRETVTTIEGIGSAGNNVRVSDQMFDVFGRLIKISEPSTAGGPDDATRYGYDMSDHLTEVGLAPDDNPRTSFRYDGRGNLVLEKTPEIDAPVAHGYDSRANLTDTYYGATGSRSNFDLTYFYDFAERPVLVQQASGQHELKTFDYYDSGVGSRGKLSAAARHNSIPRTSAIDQVHDVIVNQTYAYSGTTGRMTTRTDSTFDGDGSADYTFSATTNFGYDAFGHLSTVVYPNPSNGMTCATCPQRTLSLAYYPSGQLRQLSDQRHEYVHSYSYYFNGLFKEIQRGGTGGSDFEEYDLSGLPRPKSIYVRTPAAPLWSTGDYTYDAEGNVLAAGSDTFTYDGVSRLTGATYPALGSGFAYQKSYAYDRFGNITTGAGASVDASHNRLTGSGFAYDPIGNMTSMPGPAGAPLQFTHDLFNKLTHYRTDGGAGIGRVFLYTPGEERLAVVNYRGNPSTATWSIRGAGPEVLRDFRREGGLWKFGEDYIYGDARLLSSVVPKTGGEQVHHLHLDHLGSIRFVTDETGNTVDAPRKYFPFGEEIAPRAQVERMQFTGHERDDDGTLRTAVDLDYMHARYYSATLGRFLSLDAAPGDPTRPQSWNRYSYVLNNPMTLVDADGNQEGYCAVNNSDGPVTPVAPTDKVSTFDSMVSTAVSFVPVAGTFVGACGAIQGKDMFSQQPLDGWDKATAILPFLGKAGKVLGIAEKGAAKAGRSRRIASKTMRSQWERYLGEMLGQKDLKFPTLEDGTNWVVHHVKPLVDGGKNIAQNYLPMPSWEHRDWHMLQEDFKRFAHMK